MLAVFEGVQSKKTLRDSQVTLIFIYSFIYLLFLDQVDVWLNNIHLTKKHFTKKSNLK